MLESLEGLVARIGIASKVGEILGYGVSEFTDDFVVYAMIGIILYKSIELQLHSDNYRKNGKI